MQKIKQVDVATATGRSGQNNGRAKEAMKTISFTTMRDFRYKTELVAMMRALYVEDEADSPVDQSQFPANIESLV